MTIKNRKKNISAEPGDIVIDVTKNTLTKTNNNSNFSNNLILTIKQQDYINETNTPHTKTIEIPMSEVVRLAYLQNNYYNKTDADTKFGVTVEQTTAEAGSAATYVIKQNNTQVGTKINIPKDFLVKSASLKTSTANNKPIAGINKNDKYLDFVINAKDNSETDTHIYINVKDLVDIYTADESTLTLSNSNQFSIKDGGITESKLSNTLQTKIDNKVDKIEGKGLSTYDYTKADKTLVGTIASKATTEYVDEQILGVLDPNGVVRLEIASKADAIHTHVLGDLTITSTFDGTEDLNDFTTQGRYKCGATANKTVKNVPFYNIAFILDVINYNPTTPVQIIYTVTGNSILAQTWYRVKSGDWTDWEQLSGVERIYPKINPDGTGENNNLNNYMNQGTYICWTSANANSVENTPVNTAFSLIVLPTAYSSTYYGCTQIVKTYNVSGDNANQIWTRNYFKSGTDTETWTDWDCVSYDGHTHVKEDITNFSHQHNKADINVVTIPKNADLDDDNYWNVGIYYIGSTNGGTISNRPENLTGNFAFELEVCGYGSTLLQILKVLTSNNNAEKIYYRAKTGAGMSQWFRIATYDEVDSLSAENIYINHSNQISIADVLSTKAPIAHTDSVGAYGKATKGLYGHIKLSSETNSTSEDLAATPKAINTVYNLANSKPDLGTTATTAAKGNHQHAFGILTSGNIDNLTEDGVYGISKAKITRDPPDITGTMPPITRTNGVRSFILEQRQYSSGNYIQFAYILTTNEDYNRIFYRTYTASNWDTWREIIQSTDLDEVLTQINHAENEIDELFNNLAHLDDTFAQIKHDYPNTMAGGGTALRYGHVLLSDSYGTSQGAAQDSVGASSKAVCDAYANVNNKITSITEGNTDAQNVSITGSGWLGTVNLLKRNGWCIVAFDKLRKTTVTSRMETIAELNMNNVLGMSIGSNYIVGNTLQDAVRLEVSADGALRGNALLADHAVSGFIIFPYL